MSAAYSDPSQFDTTSPYYDPKALPTTARWLAIDICYAIHFRRSVSFIGTKQHPALSEIALLK